MCEGRFRAMSRRRMAKKAVLCVRETHGHKVEFPCINHDRWQDDEGRNVLNRWSHNQGTDVPRSPLAARRSPLAEPARRET